MRFDLYQDGKWIGEARSPDHMAIQIEEMTMDYATLGEMERQVNRDPLQDLADLMVEIYPWLPNAMALLKRCRQDAEWTTHDGQTLTLEQMTTSHASNLIRWLECRAYMIHVAAACEATFAEAAHDGGEWAHEALEAVVREVEAMQPLDFLRATALYGALVAKVEREQARPAARSERPRWRL